MKEVADEFLDLFTQMFYSTAPWGYLGIGVVILASLATARNIKYSWLFTSLLQILMVINYIGAGTSYTYHIILLVIGAIFTIVLGVEKHKS